MAAALVFESRRRGPGVRSSSVGCHREFSGRGEPNPATGTFVCSSKMRPLAIEFKFYLAEFPQKILMTAVENTRIHVRSNPIRNSFRVLREPVVQVPPVAQFFSKP